MKRLAILLLVLGLGSPVLVQAKVNGKKSPHYHKPRKFKKNAGNYYKQHKGHKKPAS
jgi:hypothetical protein